MTEFQSLSLSPLLPSSNSLLSHLPNFFLTFISHLFTHHTTPDANKFREEFDKYKSLNASPTKPAAEDKLTEEMDKLKVDDKDEKDAGDTSDPNTSESSEEGVKAKSGTSATDNAQDSTIKDEQTDQQSGPAE